MRRSVRQSIEATACLGIVLLSHSLLFAEEPVFESVSSTVPVIETVPSPEQRFLVTESIVDLRREPRSVATDASLKSPYEADPLQETQLLFGEEAVLKEEKGSWVRIESVEQAEFSHNETWEGYPGWVPRASLVPKPVNYTANALVAVKYAPLFDGPKAKKPSMELPLGARVNVLFQRAPWARVERPGQPDGWMRMKHLRLLRDLPKDEMSVRQSILKTARLFLREPYYWGGRCSHRTDILEHPTGVDCSALVNLAYRLAGVDVPRDAHEQYMKSRPALIRDMQPGDLIFLSKTENPNQVTHVMIYLGGDHAIEAVQEYDVVRIVSMKEKVGKALSEIAGLEPVGGRFVFLGRLLLSE